MACVLCALICTHIGAVQSRWRRTTPHHPASHLPTYPALPCGWLVCAVYDDDDVSIYLCVYDGRVWSTYLPPFVAMERRERAESWWGWGWASGGEGERERDDSAAEDSIVAMGRPTRPPIHPPTGSLSVCLRAVCLSVCLSVCRHPPALGSNNPGATPPTPPRSPSPPLPCPACVMPACLPAHLPLLSMGHALDLSLMTEVVFVRRLCPAGWPAGWQEAWRAGPGRAGAEQGYSVGNRTVPHGWTDKRDG